MILKHWRVWREDFDKRQHKTAFTVGASNYMQARALAMLLCDFPIKQNGWRNLIVREEVATGISCRYSQ